MQNILDKFTNHYKNVLFVAWHIAQRQEGKLISPEHLLWACLKERGSLAAEILSRANLSPPDQVKIVTSLIMDKKINTRENLPLSGEAKRVVEKSVLVAADFQHRYVGTEHLLFGLIKVQDKKISQILNSQNIDSGELETNLKVMLKSTSRFSDLTRELSEEESKEVLGPGPRVKEAKASALEFFSTNLTSSRSQKSIDPVIGRQAEIERIIQILARRNKNNPILLGDPGVGKTAIVEGLAKKIVAGDVPDILLNKSIYTLDLSALVAGTIYRGEFESRIKQIIEETKKNPNIILFIDEIHNIIGAGSASGSLDAANILKPALARGEIRCIGATTYEEYKKNIESDPALERRFQAIQVDEPSVEETVTILHGIKDTYEKHHRVKITEDAIQAAATLSHRYLSEKFLPDKAIDLIDEAASKLKVSKRKNKQGTLIKNLEKELEKLVGEKQRAVKDENFPRALKIKEEEKNLTDKITKLQESISHSSKEWIGEIGEDHVAEIIHHITKIPLGDVVRSEREKIINLEKQLARAIVGQDEALKTLAASIKRARAGLSGAEKPLGSFIFMGPSGVGKTETAKALAAEIFGDNQSLIRFDMSEFAESFNLSKLIGAPAGYVGYKEGGKLTEAVRRRPHAVILLDEIEKAHPEIFNILLQILDAGHLSDAAGKKVDFRNTLIIMTSNIGLANFNKQAALGFNTEDAAKTSETGFKKVEATSIKGLKDKFRPEFINRIDKIIVFKPLNSAQVKKITKLQLAKLISTMHAQGIEVDISPSVEATIAKKSLSPEQGARMVHKMIQTEIEDPLADLILSQKNDQADKFKISAKAGKLSITKK